MQWVYSHPEKEGKYVVQTKSTILKTVHTLSATFKFTKKGTPSWLFRNQDFYRYLKE